MKSNIELYRDLIRGKTGLRLGQDVPLSGADKLIIMGLVALMFVTLLEIRTG